MAKPQPGAKIGAAQTTPSRTPTTMSGSTSASAETKRKMIAEAAYYIAQQRGFQGGDSTRDWLAAEAQIEQMLKKTH